MKYELCERNINRVRVEMVKEEENKERSKGKFIHWERRYRKIKQQRIWIVDN
jgi:hypothetical protein